LTPVRHDTELGTYKIQRGLGRGANQKQLQKFVGILKLAERQLSGVMTAQYPFQGTQKTMPTILMRNSKTVFTRPARWFFPQTADEF